MLTLPITSLQRLNPKILTELLQVEARNSPRQRVRIVAEPAKAGDVKPAQQR